MNRSIPLSRARRELASLLRGVEKRRDCIVITHKHKPMGKLVPPSVGGHYTVTILPAGNDAFIPMPAPLLAELGWAIGDYLVLDRSDTGGIALRRVDKREPL